MKKKKALEEGQHDCIFTVTIAKASETDPEFSTSKDRERGTGKQHEAPRAQTYFHCSYKLLPSDKDVVKTDVVTFGIAAKLYSENDSRVLRTWTEGKLTWVAWQNSHRIAVTRDTLLKMFGHTVELKMWDSKDKVSTKARFDRPKGFKLPQSRGSDEVDLYSLREVLEREGLLVENFPNMPSSNSVSSKQSGSPQGTTKSASEKKRVTISEPTTPAGARKGTVWENPDEINVKVVLDKSNQPEFYKLLNLAASGIDDATNDDGKDSDEIDTARSSVGARSRAERDASKTPKLTSGAVSRLSKRKKQEQHALNINQNGLAIVPVQLSHLFAGKMVLSNTLTKPAGTIESVVITISLDCPLLSEPQRKVLNPMVFTLCSISNLPSLPELKDTRESYDLIYSSYTFFNENKYSTKKMERKKKMNFQDTHVVLLGILQRERLLEYLQGPPLEIEVHDRDRIWLNRKGQCQAFGAKAEDMHIGDVNLLSGSNMIRNPFLGKEKPWDPYGIAKIDLSGLLLGERFLEMRAPICNCPLPDPLLRSREDGDRALSIPNYLECGSELKVKIEVAYPLVSISKDIASKEKQEPLMEEECPFNRIVYIFRYTNGKLLRQLLSQLIQINSEALQLQGNPRDVLEAALSTYKLNDSEKSSTTLDIITGFQIIDDEYHIFVLEGLRDKGIQKLWTTLPQGNADGPETIIVLYNSELMFHERLYVSLDVDITRVRLHKPLSDIVQQPLLYVRDLIPKPCYEAVVKLHELSKTSLIKDVVRNDLFPSAESVVSLSKEFGIPLTFDEIQEMEKNDGEEELINSEEPELGTLNVSKPLKTSRAWTPLDYRNVEYEEIIKERSKHELEKNFIEKNKFQMTYKEQGTPQEKIQCDINNLHLQRAHNYSTQLLNSTEKAKEKLRNELKKEPKTLFTYSDNYQSATFVPVDIEELKRQEKALSKKTWQTSHGFIYPGMKTSLQANSHPSRPDFARLDELKKPWKENKLHASILKPTVDRIEFPWHMRDKDFDVLKAPDDYFGTKVPNTIFLTGDTLKREQRLAADNEKCLWESKLVVDDVRLKTYRCLPATELSRRGHKASSQLGRLDDMLKDAPQKFSLASKGMKLEKVPALSVLMSERPDNSPSASASHYYFAMEQRRRFLSEPSILF